MKKITLTTLAFVAFILANPVSAADGLKNMIGTWSWEKFTVEVKDCKRPEKLCAKVTKGPKNVGMEMIQSKLEPKGKHFVGKIKHPKTGDIYNTKLTFSGKDAWQLDGCTDKNVCAKGTFKRIK